MPVERLDPRCVGALTEEARTRAIESDFRIRSGLCPNGCGLMGLISYGQECPKCSFSCNTLPEKQVAS